MKGSGAFLYTDLSVVRLSVISIRLSVCLIDECPSGLRGGGVILSEKCSVTFQFLTFSFFGVKKNLNRSKGHFSRSVRSNFALGGHLLLFSNFFSNFA